MRAYVIARHGNGKEWQSIDRVRNKRIQRNPSKDTRILEKVPESPLLLIFAVSSDLPNHSNNCTNRNFGCEKKFIRLVSSLRPHVARVLTFLKQEYTLIKLCCVLHFRELGENQERLINVAQICHNRAAESSGSRSKDHQGAFEAPLHFASSRWRFL